MNSHKFLKYLFFNMNLYVTIKVIMSDFKSAEKQYLISKINILIIFLIVSIKSILDPSAKLNFSQNFHLFH